MKKRQKNQRENFIHLQSCEYVYFEFEKEFVIVD